MTYAPANLRELQASCVVGDCQRPREKRGWCHMHYARWQRRGTTELPAKPTLVERFWVKVAIPDNPRECWPWVAFRNADGYGQFQAVHGETPVRAHRFAYEALRGPIPAGLEIDHLCRNRACVNPWHLEAVTTAVNSWRGTSPAARNARVTRCPRGHPYDSRNTYVVRTNSGGSLRQCRKCRTIHMRTWRQRQRGEAA